MQLKHATFKHIEAEIENYRATLQQIFELRQEIIHENHNLPEERVQCSANTSTVERRATRLADSILLREMDRITTAIKEAYERASDDCKLILWGKYDLSFNWAPPDNIRTELKEYNRYTLPHPILAQYLHITERTFYGKRSWFIKLVATKLGWS